MTDLRQAPRELRNLPKLLASWGQPGLKRTMQPLRLAPHTSRPPSESKDGFASRPCGQTSDNEYIPLGRRTKAPYLDGAMPVAGNRLAGSRNISDEIENRFFLNESR